MFEYKTTIFYIIFFFLFYFKYRKDVSRVFLFLYSQKENWIRDIEIKVKIKCNHVIVIWFDDHNQYKIIKFILNNLSLTQHAQELKNNLLDITL